MGSWFVDLADVESAALIPRAIAASLGVPPEANVGPWRAVVEYLKSSASLIILDNAEPHLDVCGQLVTAMLAAGDGVTCCAPRGNG